MSQLVWRGELRGVPSSRTAGTLHKRSSSDSLRLSLTTSASHTQSITGTSLDFVAFVDPHRVPLHLAAGSSLHLQPDDEAMQERFIDLLVHQDDGGTSWYMDGEMQSRIGILASLRRLHMTANMRSNIPLVTELLLYASCSEPEKSTLLAPAAPYAFRLWALPLSSEQLPHSVLPVPVQEPELINLLGEEGLKKTRLSDLFDNASEQRKRARRAGGVSVSLAASRNTSFSFTESTSGDANGRAPSLVPDNRSESVCETERADTSFTSAAKRTSVTQIGPTSDSFKDQSFEARNKQTISRAVMACMRVYNMQQRKPNGKGSGRGDIQTSADDEEKDLEYKAVYHQTYKGTMFAFVSGIIIIPHLNPRATLTPCQRRQLEGELLHQDMIHDVADKLLAVFCALPG